MNWKKSFKGDAVEKVDASGPLLFAAMLEKDAEIKRLKANVDFLIDSFSARDAANKAMIVQLENANLTLAQTVAWFRGAYAGNAPTVQGLLN